MKDGGRKPSIPQVFQGQSILVTGGTGFMGKVLLEKLLRCCPGVRRIYLIVRPKRGAGLRERMEGLLGHSFFDRCRAERGIVNWCCGSAEVSAVEDDKKGPLVIGIPGDVSEKGLGLDEGDRSHLELHVTVVFHFAATVRFNEPLRKAVYVNVRGTREILDLASRMPLLKAFVHVSTAYAHASNHDTIIREKFYSVPMEPEDVIEAAEEFSDEKFNVISKKLAAIYQNTYLCTKALTERLIEKNYIQLPISVLRPGIVGAVHRNPTPGWAEAYQGPSAIIYGCASGLFGLIYGIGKLKPELVPVDHVVNAVMAVAWATIVDKDVSGTNKEIPIFNHVSSNHTDFTWSKFRRYANQVLRLSRETSRLGEVMITPSYTAYEFSAHLRLLFCKLVDVMNHMRGEKSNVALLQKKVKSGFDIMWYFMITQFKFSDDGLINLRERFYKEVDTDGSGYDLSEFDFTISAVEWKDYVQRYVDHIRQDLLKFHADKLEIFLKIAQKFKTFERSIGLAGIFLSFASVYYLGTSFQWIYQNIVSVHNNQT